MLSFFNTIKGHIVQAIGAPMAGIGGSFILSMQNDVIRVFGITLSNWCLILSFAYGLFQAILALLKLIRMTTEND